MPKGPQIAIMDFGSQHTLQIKRACRDLGFHSEVMKPEEFEALSALRNYRCVIGSGGHRSIYEDGAPRIPDCILPGREKALPFMGICYAMQASMFQHGAIVEPGTPEYAKTTVLFRAHPLFKGLSDLEQEVWMSHGDKVGAIPEEFDLLGLTEGGIPAAVMHKKFLHVLYQFHPEVSHTPEGKVLIKNFLNFAWCEPDYRPDALQDIIGNRIDQLVGPDDHVILLYSGGVDSSVAGCIAQKRLGARLHAVTFDAGHLREGEADEIRRNAEICGINLTVLDCADEFIDAISKSIDPEQKREAFRVVYPQLACAFAAKHSAKFVMQGTIAPDRIESGKTGGAKIKTHHNSEGLDFGDLIEIHPIEDLYKDEVRALARQCDLPLEIFNRRPFPGPGDFIRVVGIAVDRENLAVVQWAEARVRELADADPRYKDVAQIVVAILGKSVGVKGDKRCLGYTIGVRAVLTKDFMTAEGVAFEPDFQKRVAKKLGEHPLIVQVGFFPTDKPPGTTEFE